MKSKILTFRDRFDILMEIRLSGVAKRLIWEIPDETNVKELYYAYSTKPRIGQENYNF